MTPALPVRDLPDERCPLCGAGIVEDLVRWATRDPQLFRCARSCGWRGSRPPSQEPP